MSSFGVTTKRISAAVVIVGSAVLLVLGVWSFWSSNTAFFDNVNLALKIVLVLLASAGAIHSAMAQSSKPDQPMPSQVETRATKNLTVTLLSAAAVLGLLSLLLDFSGQKQATQTAINRQTSVINELKKVVLPLNGAIRAHFSVLVDARQKELGSLANTLLKKTIVGGRRRYGWVEVGTLNGQDPTQSSLANFVSGLDLSFLLCSREDCYFCGEGIDPRNPRGVEMVASVPFDRPQPSLGTIHSAMPSLAPSSTQIFVRLQAQPPVFDIGVNSAPLDIRPITDTWTNSDDLKSKFVFVAAPSALKYEIRQLTFSRADGRLLEVKVQARQRCGTTYYGGQLSDHWQ